MKSYLEFLQFSIDSKKAVPESVEDIDWHGLFDFSKKQAIIGVIFDAIQRLEKKWDGEEKALLMKWFALAEQIRKEMRLSTSNLSFCLSA